MNRTMLLTDLDQAKARVVVGEQDIALQKDLIGELILEGLVTRAKGESEFLRALELTQALYVTHRDFLEKELATTKAA